MVKSNVYIEKGWTGLEFMAGQIMEDPNLDLRGRAGAEAYNNMRYQDPTVAGVLMALTLPIREAQWQVNPASDQPADLEAAEFVESCLHDMSSSLDDVLTEASTMFCFGWSFMEWTLKRRLGRSPGKGKPSSAHDDGRIGFRKIALRKQTSLWEWELDGDGGILGMWQERMREPPVLIPIEKALLFRTTREGNNPEGLSILRPAYRDYTFKRNIERIEAIGLQRALMGVPVVTLGAGAVDEDSNPNNSHEAKAKTLLHSLHKNDSTGVIEEAEILTFRFESPDMTGVTGDSDRVIQRKDEGIARAALASWLLLGTREKGSYALARELGDMFFLAVEGYLQTISQVFTRWAIPTLFSYNAFPGITGYPEITTSINRRVDLEAIASVVNGLVDSAVIVPDVALEQHIREIAGLPRKAVEVEGEEPKEPVTPAPEDEGEDVIAGPKVAEKEGAARIRIERFARLPTLDRYRAATDDYKDALIMQFERWLDETAAEFSRVDPEDVGAWYDQSWPESVAVLAGLLKALSWEWIPEAYALGFKSSAIPPEQRREVEYEIAENDAWMDAKLATAVEHRINLPDLVEISYMPQGERLEAFRGLVIGKRGHVGQYSGAFWRAIWVGAMAYYVLRNEMFKVRWITDAMAKHCPDCLMFGDVTYENFTTLMRHTGGILPGNGTACDGNCRCYLARDDGATLIVI